MYSCRNCSCQFKLLLALQNHMKSTHQQEPFDCSNDLLPFHCDGCINFQTHFQTQLKQHIQQDHAFQGTQLLYSCRTCRFDTYSICVLFRHIYLHKCLYEPLKINDSLEKELNVIDARVVQWFKCEYCPFQAQFKGNLRIHQRKLHFLDTTCLKCDLCPFETSDKTMFDNHIQSHMKPEPEVVVDSKEYGIVRIIAASENYEVYENSEDEHITSKGKKKFKCQFCRYRTSSKQFLHLHVINRHGTLEYFRCGECSYKARRRGTVKRHIQAKHVNLT